MIFWVFFFFFFFCSVGDPTQGLDPIQGSNCMFLIQFKFILPNKPWK
jgi:hypothetical protein